MNIGSIYRTEKCGNVIVVDFNSNYATVKFLNTGTVKKFRKGLVKKGNIRDPYAKNVCNIACTGNIKTRGNYYKYYAVWHDMINRCYNKNNKRYNAYVNVSVSDDWLTFENFYNDCKEIEGFNQELFDSGELVLDKDIKQRFFPKKIYSKDTCMWVTKNINNSIQDSQQRLFYALSPKGEKYMETNITKFAKEYNLNRKNISAVLHGRGKTVHGWQFSYEEIA